MGKRFSHWLGIALTLSLVAISPAHACDPAPPDLRAAQVGSNVVLSWTGTLAAGEKWALYHGDLRVLWDAGFNDTAVAALAVAQYTDAGGAADADWDYYRVRCEGPGGDGPYSNLGFKAVRSFDTVTDAAGVDFLNVYFVSLPERLGIPDIADSTVPNPCAPPAGTGDGIVNADDLLCSWWTSRRGSLMVSALDAGTCTYLDRMILLEDSDPTAAPQQLFLGSWTAPLSGGQPLMVTVNHPPGSASALNSGVMVGSADPARPCQQVTEPALLTGVDCAPRQMLLSIPWEGIDRTAREILCGRPGGCNAGIFNNAPGFQKALTVWMFDNIDDDSVNTPDDSYVAGGISFSALAGLRFDGTDFDLGPTDALLTLLSVGHGSTPYCPERR